MIYKERLNLQQMTTKPNKEVFETPEFKSAPSSISLLASPTSCGRHLKACLSLALVLCARGAWLDNNNSATCKFKGKKKNRLNKTIDRILAKLEEESN